MENWQVLVKEKEFNDLLIEWNNKINLVSRLRKDVFDLIEESKRFFEAIDFKEGINILDLGTGGGLPGIVIAIYHPEANITLVDSIQKKINVVNDIVKKLGLKNAAAVCLRAEELAKESGHNKKYDYVVARSVAVLQDLCKWSKDLLKPGGKLVTVKGGDISGETKKTRKMSFVKRVDVYKSNDRKIVIVNT